MFNPAHRLGYTTLTAVQCECGSFAEDLIFVLKELGWIIEDEGEEDRCPQCVMRDAGKIVL